MDQFPYPDEPKPRRGRRALRVLLIVVVVLVLVVSLAPRLARSAIREGIVEEINDAIPGTVRVGDLRLSWTGTQELEDLELRDPEGELVVRIERIKATTNFLWLLTGHPDLGRVTIYGLRADLRRDAEGSLNLLRAVETGEAAGEPEGGGEARAKEDLELPEGFRMEVAVEDGTIRYHEPGMEAPLGLMPFCADFIVEGSEANGHADVMGFVSRDDDLLSTVRMKADSVGLRSAQVDLKLDWGSIDPANPMTRRLEGLFGADLTTSVAVDASGLQVSAIAERFRLEGDLRSQSDGELTLAKPLTLLWTPDPSALTTDEAAELPSGLSVDLSVEQLRWPLDGMRLEDLTLEASCTLSDGEARLPVAGKTQEIAWRDWSMRVKAAPLGREVQAQLTGSLSSGADVGAVSLDARARELLDADQAQVQGLLRVSEFPIDALDRLLGGLTGQPGLLVDLFGDRLEVEAKSETVAGGNVTVEVGARSPRLKLVAPLTIDLKRSRVTADQTTAWLDLTEAVAKRFAGSVPVEGDVPVRLQVDRLDARFDRLEAISSAIDAEISVERLSAAGESGSLKVSVEKEAGSRTVNGKGSVLFGAGGGIVALTLELPEEEGRLLPRDLDGIVTLRVIDLPLATVEKFAGLDGVLVDALGPKLTGSAEILGSAGTATLESEWNARRLTATLQGSMDSSRQVSLEGSSSLTLTPALASRFGIDLDQPVQAHAKAPGLHFPLPFVSDAVRGEVELTTGSFDANRVNVRKLEARLGLGVSGAEATLQCRARARQVQLDNALGGSVAITIHGTRPWGSDSVVGRADLESVLVKFGLDARVDGEGSVAVKGEGGVRMWKEEEYTPATFELAVDADGQATLSAKSQQFPLALVDNRLADLFGSRAAIDVQATYPDEARVSLRSSVVELAAEFDLGETIRLREPTTAKWSLTPRSWSALVGDAQSGFRLGGPAAVALKLDRFVYAPSDPAQLDLLASAEIERLVLAERESGARATLRALKLGVVGRDLRKPIRISIDGVVEDPAKPGRIRGQLELLAWDDKAQAPNLDPSALTFDSKLQLDEIPVGPLDRALGLEGRGLAVLGDRVSAVTESHLKRGRGPVSVRLTSGNAKADIALRVDRRVARLEKPLEAQIEFNDRMAAVVLPELGPLFSGVESTEQPIKLRIEKRNFALPLDRFDVKRVTIPRMRVDIGRVVLNNLWLADVIQQVTRSRRPDKRTTTWFTPLELEMRNGVIRYRSRLDLLTQESMHLSSWGTVDLGRDRLDLTLAFMTDSLRKHLGVKKARDGDTLQVPIRGSLDKPRVELTAALAGLAQVRAEAEAADKIKEKWARALIEATLDALLKKTLRASPVPRASVSPLPWAVPPR